MYRSRARTAGALTAILAALLLLLAACGGTSAGTSAGPTATPDAATIAQKTQAAITNIKDASFNVRIQSSGGSSTQAVSGTGTGKLTRNPERLDMTLNGTFAGQQGTVSIITDQPTASAYVQTAQTQGKWVKLPIATLGMTEGIGTLQLQNPTYVGTDTINGVKTYHIRGTQSASATATVTSGTPVSASETTDVWVNQQNYEPVRIVTTGSDGTTTTIDFTAINTGITITPPPDDQVIPLPTGTTP